MMKKASQLVKKIYIPVLMMSLIIMQGCVKSDEIVTTGSIVGFVTPVDESGTVVNDKSGIIVRLEGTDREAITAPNGRYEFSKVATGSYSMSYGKKGYGTYYINNLIVAGGEIPSVVQPYELYQQPTLAITSVTCSSYYSQGLFFVEISGSFTPTDKYRLMACAGTDADVSDTHFDKTIMDYYNAGVETTQFFVGISFNPDTYSSGQKIYIVLYLLNINDKVSYYNSLTGCYMYQSAVKASDVQMITL